MSFYVLWLQFNGRTEVVHNDGVSLEVSCICVYILEGLCDLGVFAICPNVGPNRRIKEGEQTPRSIAINPHLIEAS